MAGEGPRVSLPKRFPGRCVIRFKMWTEKRTVIELEGPTDQRVASACLVLMSRKLPDETVAHLETLLRSLGIDKETR